MSRWLITHRDTQFAAEDINELRRMAAQGKIGPADMVQPPGATDWLYASEIPELKGLLQDDGDDDDLDMPTRRGPPTMIIAVVLLAVILVGGGAMYNFYGSIPQGDQSLLGAQGLKMSEMVVTNDGVSLFSDPDLKGPVAAVSKNEVLDLKAKRGDVYRAQRKPENGGQEGWLRIDQVIPMYQFGGKEAMEDYDPLYNPDKYVFVRNASWLALPPDERTGEESNVTVFNLELVNTSKFDATDVVLVAIIKDGKGTELEQVEIPIEGIVPLNSQSMVGTLAPPEDVEVEEGEEEPAKRLLTNYTFSKMAEEDEDLQLRYSEGVEAVMSAEEFTEAEIRLLEVRAVPKE